MAQAVVEIFPEAKLAIGPPIQDGFYYDFDLPRALTPEDLEEIEGPGAEDSGRGASLRDSGSEWRRSQGPVCGAALQDRAD